MNGLSVCSGIGGIELGLRLALGATYRTVCYVEVEAYCVEILVRRMQEGWLDEAPVWDDIETFPCEDWRGRVDLISAGFPCQPVSCAGQRKAQDDERWLWPHIINIIREVWPEWVFLENVRGLLSANSGRAFAEVLGGLANLGYDVEWDCFRASDVGAPHRRERIFILAHSSSIGPRTRRTGDEGFGRGRDASIPGCELADAKNPDGRPRGQSIENKKRLGRRGFDGGHSELADPDSAGREKGQPSHIISIPQDEIKTVGNAEDNGLEGRGSRLGHSRQIPTWPPGPTERDGWAEILERWPELAPAVDDANCRNGGDENATRRDLQTRAENSGEGEAPSTTESPVRRMAHGHSSRVDRLRSLGNAVVPAVAATAFKILYERITK